MDTFELEDDNQPSTSLQREAPRNQSSAVVPDAINRTTLIGE